MVQLVVSVVTRRAPAIPLHPGAATAPSEASLTPSTGRSSWIVKSAATVEAGRRLSQCKQNRCLRYSLTSTYEIKPFPYLLHVLKLLYVKVNILLYGDDVFC